MSGDLDTAALLYFRHDSTLSARPFFFYYLLTIQLVELGQIDTQEMYLSRLTEPLRIQFLISPFLSTLCDAFLSLFVSTRCTSTRARLTRNRANEPSCVFLVPSSADLVSPCSRSYLCSSEITRAFDPRYTFNFPFQFSLQLLPPTPLSCGRLSSTFSRLEVTGLVLCELPPLPPLLRYPTRTILFRIISLDDVYSPYRHNYIFFRVEEVEVRMLQVI